MVAFTPANLPSNINTVEKVAAWACAVLAYYIPNEKIFESTLVDTLIAESVQVPMRDGEVRNIGRVNLKLDPLYLSNGKKIWENVQEMKTVTIGTTFTTNSTVT